MSEEKKLTKWEAGNELVRVADECSYVIGELKDWPELRKAVEDARRVIERAFYDNKLDEEMEFGI